MKANELCPAPHLEAADLDPKVDTVVTIESVQMETIGEDKIDRGTLKFKEFPRTMVLNRTNLKRCIEHLGDDASLWIGKQIELYPSETDFGGRTVPCIRVRQKQTQ